jgi:hypothetical protein
VAAADFGEVALLARHPLPSAMVLAVLAAVAAVFAFARPEYHAQNRGTKIKLDLSKYPPASHRWQWADGQPGFRFGHDEDKWNLSQVKPAELSPVRSAARRWGVAPKSVRVISAIRLGPDDLSMIVAGTNAGDKTCLGFVTPTHATAFYCPPRLGAQSAFVLVTTRAPFEVKGVTSLPTFLTGIASGDVTRVVVNQPQNWRNTGIYDRKRGSPWGTFELSLSTGRDIDLLVYRQGGAVQTVHIDETEPGERLIQVSG